jgi:hypothetical protein
MLKVLGAITATAIVLGASTAFAGATAAESSYNKVKAEWAKSQAVGGYGFPLTAVPVAIGETIGGAFTGRDSRGQTAQGQKGKAQSN